MSDHLFASAWLKWGQAIVHAQALEADIDAVCADPDSDPLWSFRTEYNAKRHGFRVIPQVVSFLPIKWNMLLGDVASNYRAALDHLAWAVVTRGRTPPDTLTTKQASSIYFPVHGDRRQFNGELPIKLPGARRADIAKIRARQPYHHGPKRRTRHAFALLATINNQDKHRSIEPLWAFPARVDIEITDARDCTLPKLGIRRHATPVEVGTELAFVRARKTGPNPELEMQIRLTPEPCLDNSLGVKEWITRCGIEIWSLLGEFSEQPPELADLGAKLVKWR